DGISLDAPVLKARPAFNCDLADRWSCTLREWLCVQQRSHRDHQRKKQGVPSVSSVIHIVLSRDLFDERFSRTAHVQISPNARTERSGGQRRYEKSEAAKGPNA